MLQHRFRELVPATATPAIPGAAFVAWPLPGSAPQAMLLCLAYRLAAEMFAAQFPPSAVRPVPEFSHN